MRRTTAAAGVVVLLALTSTACSPLTVGVLGVGADGDGSPVAYLQVCDQHLDSVLLYSPDVDGERGGEWTATTPVSDSAVLDLQDPGDGWTVRTALPDLLPGTSYSLHAWSSSRFSNVGAESVQFTADDLAALRPGDVRRREGDVVVVESEADFAKHACDYVDGLYS
ncbi:hypothetical protein ASD16_12330 [Cellulomonas sp. Root485]|nr:hypothetical protein ASD16_12330 [Cellulomonas sp. Root485]